MWVHPWESNTKNASQHFLNAKYWTWAVVPDAWETVNDLSQLEWKTPNASYGMGVHHLEHTGCIYLLSSMHCVSLCLHIVCLHVQVVANHIITELIFIRAIVPLCLNTVDSESVLNSSWQYISSKMRRSLTLSLYLSMLWLFDVGHRAPSQLFDIEFLHYSILWRAYISGIWTWIYTQLSFPAT